jgi:hypothetical protein
MGLVEEILEVDPDIRFVAHLDKDMKLLEMKMRPGVKPLTSEKTDEEFFSICHPIIRGVAGKLEDGFGKLKTLRIKYERGSIVFFSIHDEMIAISMNPTPITRVVAKIGARYGIDLE